MTASLIPENLFSNYHNSYLQKFKIIKDLHLASPKSWKIEWLKLQDVNSSILTFGDLEIIKKLSENRRNPVIYYFTIEKKDRQKIFDQYQKHKNESALLRRDEGVTHSSFKNISYVPPFCSDSNCLYVGSRKENMHRRLKDHLGFSSGRTGALYLSNVLNELNPLPKITFHYYILGTEYREVTTHIESAIQTHLNPIIGKNLLGD